jgi:nitronate monooxygenase
MPSNETALTRHAGIRVPLIGGPMYPCSNPELVAAVSAAGGIGIVQPISLTFVHKYEYRAGLRYIRSLTDKPIGLNALIESSSQSYHQRTVRYVEVALEEGVRFFVTSLGNPRWVVDLVHAAGGVVYHDVTEAKWALKARDGGVDGLIAVNAEAGGHAGTRSPAALLEELSGLGLPVVGAGGVGSPAQFAHMLALGYAGVQLGTRFIATEECTASAGYKDAIVRARADDIVLTERLSGVPVAVIKTPFVEKLGTRIGPISRRLFKGRRTKKWMRSYYALRSLWSLRRSLGAANASRDYWQAGRSVEGITRVERVEDVVAAYEAAWRRTIR